MTRQYREFAPRKLYCRVDVRKPPLHRENMIELVCPDDHGELTKSGNGWACASCGREYPEAGKVVRFMDGDDSFYEGTYLNQIGFIPGGEQLRKAWPLWLINNGYVWRVRNNVPAGSVVLELGCAGGVKYFGARYRMIGLDVSMSSLEAAAEVYESCIQADASRGLPLPDASVDAIASSFFWEHIPPDVKPAMLRELRRVLRPAGRLIFLYDVETSNPLVSAMRRSSAQLYDAEFIVRDGHLGYQRPAENIDIFEREGFRVVEQLGLERTPLQSTSVYSKMRKWPQPFSIAGSLLNRIDRSRVSYFGYIALLRGLDETIGRLLPERWSRMALTVCEKT